MRLVDADELIRRAVAERDSVEIKTGCDIGYHNGLNMVVSMATNAPTVDAVEIVRCEDCEHNRPYIGVDGRRHNNCTHPRNGVMWLPDCHFCSYGERRAEDGEND